MPRPGRKSCKMPMCDDVPMLRSGPVWSSTERTWRYTGIAMRTVQRSLVQLPLTLFREGDDES